MIFASKRTWWMFVHSNDYSIKWVGNWEHLGWYNEMKKWPHGHANMLLFIVWKSDEEWSCSVKVCLPTLTHGSTVYSLHH